MTTARENNPGHFLADRAKEIIAQREFSLLLVLVVASAFMTYMSPVFFTWANIEAILLALSVDAIIAIGMVVLLISGGLDLSVG